MADSMLYQTMAIVDNHNFVIDSYIKEGENLSGADHAFYEGHYYSGFLPGASFLAIPIYFIVKPLFKLFPDSFLGYSSLRLSVISLNILATIFLVSLFSALLSVLIYKFVNYFPGRRWIKISIPFVFSFCTIIFLYSTGFDSRILSSFFSFYAFFLLFKIKKNLIAKKSLFLFIAGLSVAFAVTIDLPQILVVICLFLYLLTFLRNKKVLLFIFGVLIPLMLLLLYNYHLFGDPLTTNYDHRANIYDKKMFEQGFHAFSYPTIERMWSFSFSPSFGLFFYMPILLLSFYGLFHALKKHKEFFSEMLIIFFVFLSTFMFYSSYLYWISHCTFGPRFFLSIIPFLMLPLVFIARKIIFWIFALVSFIINYLPVMYGGLFCYTGNNIILEHYSPLLKTGLTNYTLNLISNFIFPISLLYINLIIVIGLLILALIIYLIWKRKS